MKEDVVRLFVGVGLPDDIRLRLGELEEELRERIPGARWLRPDNLHVTLKFLGNCDAALVEAIKGKLKNVAARQTSFRFSLAGLGAFASVRRARVLWVGVGEGAARLESVAGDIEAAMEELGFRREERNFHAHVTLARLKNPAPVPEAVLDDVGRRVPTGTLTASSIILFRSRLSPRGAEYSVVGENPLKTG